MAKGCDMSVFVAVKEWGMRLWSWRVWRTSATIRAYPLASTIRTAVFDQVERGI